MNYHTKRAAASHQVTLHKHPELCKQETLVENAMWFYDKCHRTNAESVVKATNSKRL